MITAAAWTVGVICFLFVAYRVFESIERARGIREAKRRRQSGERSICKWGFDSNGNLMHVRVRVPPKG